jgi:hypothetical protein
LSDGANLIRQETCVAEVFPGFVYLASGCEGLRQVAAEAGRRPDEGLVHADERCGQIVDCFPVPELSEAVPAPARMVRRVKRDEGQLRIVGQVRQKVG